MMISKAYCIIQNTACNIYRQSQEACTIICLCLQMYIDYGTMKSIHYLSAKKKIIQTMVSICDIELFLLLY